MLLLNHKYNRLAAGIIFISLLLPSCKKLVTVTTPPTSSGTENVFKDDALAISAVTGIYARLSGTNTPSSSSNYLGTTSLFAGLWTDEFSIYDAVSQQYLSMLYTNQIPASLSNGQIWIDIYSMLFVANSSIEGLTASTQLTPAVKQQLLGESYFLRAFFYFYLVNYYGDVPLVTTTDYTVNGSIPRTAQSKVYEQMVADLKMAKTLLSPNYLDGSLVKTTPERVRPTLYAATALLSRVYLYQKDYANSELQATEIFTKPATYDTVALNDVFLKNSKETIWSIPSVGNGTQSNTGEGKYYILPAQGPNFANPIYLSPLLMNSFESGDKRKTSWTSSVTAGGINYPFVYKYKIGLVNTAPAEYNMMLRLGEQYLIRAEARAQQNKITEATADLNLIRKRAGLGPVGALSQSQLIDTIMHERRVELFSEWGHRWFDLRRTGRLDALMTAIAPSKGSVWKPYQQWFPIPATEIQTNPALVQNPGY
ncbi:MAG: RagB/SusD family nutrient uptake outer membrane protein [Bacteroidetes bacterium]|nr:RagB/SusD family nutrient uptake outer membrane protein [Bacteroidota bacterium]